MSFFTSIKSLAGACALAVCGTAAAAVPVATFDIKGTVVAEATPTPPSTALFFEGAFSGEIFDTSPELFDIYRFSAKISLGGLTLIDDFFDAPGIEVAILVTELFGPDGPPEVAAVVDYFTANTGDMVDLGDGIMGAFIYDDLVLTETTVDGSFFASLSAEEFFEESLLLLEPTSFAVHLAIAPVPIPLPAGLPLLGVGLGALGLVRRRRRA